MFKAMAQALINAGTKAGKGQIVDAISKRVTNKESHFKDGWSADLSYKTYHVLKDQGIMV